MTVRISSQYFYSYQDLNVYDIQTDADWNVQKSWWYDTHGPTLETDPEFSGINLSSAQWNEIFWAMDNLTFAHQLG